MPAPGVRVRVAVCLCVEGRILLVEHFKDGRHHWLLPGGGVEAGETLAAAAVRETREETGLEITVGRLVILCEAIEPGGRHLINPVFVASGGDGELRAGLDGVLEAAAWKTREELAGLAMHPPIAGAILDAWDEGFSGEVRVLGNVWRPD